MGTTTSSETIDYAEYLRSKRTSTQADVDRVAAEHDVDDFSARDRWSSVAY